jgi:hypothetical protein
MKGFTDPLTGKGATLDAAIANSIGKLKDAYKDTPDVSEQQKIVIDLDKTIDSGTKALKRQKQAQGELNTAVKLTSNDFDLFLRAWTQFGATRWPETTEQAREIKAETQVIADQLYLAVTRAQQLAMAGKSNTAEFATQRFEVQRIRELLSEKFPENIFGFGAPTKALESLDQISNRLDTLSEKQKEISKDAEQADPARALIDRLQNAADPIQEALRIIDDTGKQTGQSINDSITLGVINAAANTEASAKRQVAAWNSVAQAAYAAAQAAASVPGGGTAVTAARGGLIYRAAGGFTPRGTDTVPAMLSPGEFVVNAGATRKFFSQLVAMNSGRAPIYRQVGGSVGDITINVQESSSPRQTAREVATLIRREIQRGTIKNF